MASEDGGSLPSDPRMISKRPAKVTTIVIAMSWPAHLTPMEPIGDDRILRSLSFPVSIVGSASTKVVPYLCYAIAFRDGHERLGGLEFSRIATIGESDSG